MSKLQKIRDEAYNRQCGKCWYCGRQMSAATDSGAARCTAEHLVARSEGGRNLAENVVAACWLCNTRRHRRKKPLDPEIYRKYIQTRLAEGKWVLMRPR